MTWIVNVLTFHNRNGCMNLLGFIKNIFPFITNKTIKAFALLKSKLLTIRNPLFTQKLISIVFNELLVIIIS